MYDYLKIKSEDKSKAVELLKKAGLMVEEITALSDEFAKEEVEFFFENTKDEVKKFFEKSGTCLSYGEFVTAAKFIVTRRFINDGPAFDTVYETCRTLFYDNIEELEEIEAQANFFKEKE